MTNASASFLAGAIAGVVCLLVIIALETWAGWSLLESAPVGSLLGLGVGLAVVRPWRCA